MNGKQYHGKELNVCEFKKRDQRNHGEIRYTNIYACNLPTGIDEAKIRAEFSKFGTITSIKHDETKRHAFINFSEHDNAKAAKEALDGSSPFGGSEPISVQRHMTKQELIEER